MPNNREEVGSQPGVSAVDEGREAFRAIYDREFDYVWHSLRRLGIPARDLPDVTHDVFVKLHRSLVNYDTTRPFRPWLFGVLFRVKDVKSLKAVETSVLREIKNLAGGRVDAKRLDAVRSNLRYSNVMGLDTANSAAVTLAVNTALTGEVDYLNKEFAALAQVQPRDLQEFAKSHFMDLNRTTVTLVTAKGGGR